MEISIVIPTKDREKDLLECIKSISHQTFLPQEVLVIDDGEIKENIRKFVQVLLSEKNVSFRYFKKNNPDSAESKNLGAEKAINEVIVFLDDDVVLEKDYIANLIKVWEKNKKEKKLAGVSGIILNARKKSWLEQIFNRIFFLHSEKSWSILPWGFQTWDYNLKKEEKADWLPCGICSLRKKIFQKYQFQSLQPGRTALEDIEFCWRLKKDDYYFIITPLARLIHKESITGREKIFITGLKEGLNRKILFKKLADKNLKNCFCFWAASMGWILRQFLAGNFLKAFGMINGYLKKIC